MLVMWLTSFVSSPALACGGLFCNALQPVVQDAERIVFGINEADQRVDMHVQIFYEGPADEFAWVIPVEAEPELFVSNQALFDGLAQATAPIFQLQREIEGRCQAFDLELGGAEMGFLSALSASPPTGGVDVLSEQPVGPYDTVVLGASSEADLLEYLRSAGYDLPNELSTVLAPYVASASQFVALKLRKNKDVGDITPIGLSFPGTQASVPIQLTAVAAAEDLRLEVYTYAHERVVPTSYLHVTINEAAVDWWNFGQNYPDVITRAADEAGGRAFATDYFGPAENAPLPFRLESEYPVEGFRQAANAERWMALLFHNNLPLNGQLAEVVVDHVSEPPGVDPLAFLQCRQCFGDWDIHDFDAEVATADLEARILTPLSRIADLVRGYPLLTRMTSSISAAEMTVDPVFETNAILSGEDDYVDRVHQATIVYECGADRPERNAPRRLRLADGREIGLPSERWFERKRMSEVDYIADLEGITAQVIEQHDTTSEGSVLVDLTDDLKEIAGSTLGCTHSGAPAGAGLVLLTLLGLRRRSV